MVNLNYEQVESQDYKQQEGTVSERMRELIDLKSQSVGSSLQHLQQLMTSKLNAYSQSNEENIGNSNVNALVQNNGLPRQAPNLPCDSLEDVARLQLQMEMARLD